jgi:hypothetical protein
MNLPLIFDNNIRLCKNIRMEILSSSSFEDDTIHEVTLPVQQSKPIALG